ncbi:MAG: ABC transporter substrate-binding protein [Limnochordia bacterium]|jgi:multiple sugar transport system substrate-binding protein
MRSGVGLLLLCFLTLVFSLPFGAVSAPQKVVLEYYTWGSDIKTIENEQYLFSYFTNRYPHIEIEVSATGSIASHNEKITVQHAAGIAPDLYTISGSASHTSLFFDTDMVLDLTEWARRDRIDFNRFIPGAWAYTWRDGKLRAFPRSTKGTAYATGVLVYNRKLFDEGGLRYPWQGWTFDDLIGTAKKLTRSVSGGPEPDVWGAVFEAAGWYRHVWSNGGEMLDESETDISLNTPEAMEALEWYAKWPNEFGITGGSFERETAGMAYKSTGGFLRVAPAGLDWAFAETPRGPRSEQSYTVGGCNVVAISSQTKHPEEAWEVLKFLVSEENQQREVFELGAGTALLRSVAFDRRHVYREGPPYDLTPILLQATKPEPQAPGWAEAKAAINAALTPVWNGQKSVRVAIDEVLPIAKAMLRQSK